MRLKSLLLALLLSGSALCMGATIAVHGPARHPAAGGGGGAEHTDNFNRSDSTTLGALSGGVGTWVETSGDFVIGANHLVQNDVNTDSRARVDTGLSSANHYVQCAIPTFDPAPTAFNQAFVALRYAAAAETYYAVRIIYGNDAGTEIIMEISESVAGTEDVRASTTTTFVDGDVLKGSVDSGNTVRGFINGVQILSYTDPSAITGNTQWGVGGFIRSSGGAADVLIDDCEAGT